MAIKATIPVNTEIKKRPGRPRKTDASSVSEIRESTSTVERGRGRPPKEVTKKVDSNPKKRGRPKQSETEPIAKQGPGRPRKNAIAAIPTEVRRRGRPSKQESAIVTPTVKRSPGRPKKITNTPATAQTKRRGRPRKTESSVQEPVIKRRAGRPKKTHGEAGAATAKRGPGRPKKETESLSHTTPKRRGRPKKTIAPEIPGSPRRRGRPKKAGPAVVATIPKRRGRPVKATPAASPAGSAIARRGRPAQSKFQRMLMDSLNDLHHAEYASKKILTKLAKSASSSRLAEAFEQHQAETDKHVDILNQVFSAFEEQPVKGKTSDTVEGFMKMCNAAIKATRKNTMTRDAALILAAQNVEHFEISSYGTLRVYANYLGRPDIAMLLQNILDSEKGFNAQLTRIAEELVLQIASKE